MLLSRVFKAFSHSWLIAECACSTQKERQNIPDGLVWECPADNCRKRRSVKARSFFEDSKIPLAQWLYVIYLWSIDKSNKRLSLLTGLSLRTIVTVLNKICNICSMKILSSNFTLGGQGKTVEVVKSMFGNKQKYNRGRVSEGQWVFGIVERDTG